MTTQYIVNNRLFESAMNGDFPEIKRLLTSPELKIKADIHFFNDACLVLVCERGDTEIIKYLLTSSELQEHAYLHADNYQPFKAICVNNQISSISYLIFEFNMQLDDDVKFYLDRNELDACIVAKSMFEKREVAKSLHKELDNSLNANYSKNTKIKI
jgi:hypothetical protein